MQIFRDFLVAGSTFDFVLLAFLLGTFLDASIEEMLAEGLVTLVLQSFRTVHLDYLALVRPLPEKVRKRLLDEIPTFVGVLHFEQVQRRFSEGYGELLNIENILSRESQRQVYLPI